MELGSLFAEHERATVLFSGGRDSLAVLRLLEPWRDRLTLLWVNTGAMFPHMVEWVRGFGKEYDLVELRPRQSIAEHWDAFGYPSAIVPLANLSNPIRDQRLPKIQPWTSCCMTLRHLPILEWLAEHSEITLGIHGQRASDRNPGVPLGQGPAITWHSPIWGWSNDDVQAYIAEHGIVLPPQYAAGLDDSGECWVCSDHYTPERQAFTRANYPEMAGVVEPIVAKVRIIMLASVAAEFPDV